jgi:hypothetical protein
MVQVQSVSEISEKKRKDINEKLAGSNKFHYLSAILFNKNNKIRLNKTRHFMKS